VSGWDVSGGYIWDVILGVHDFGVKTLWFGGWRSRRLENWLLCCLASFSAYFDLVVMPFDLILVGFEVFRSTVYSMG
jgi:hypothetical protein